MTTLQRPLTFILLYMLLMLASANAQAGSCVVLLHGLARTADSMDKMATVLRQAGFATANIDYDSRRATIEVLAADAVPRGLNFCTAQNAGVIHFVTHSMGGILVRQYLSGNTIDQLGRVVMLAPPNKGSQLVDELREMPGYSLWNGPAGHQLGSGPESVPNSLGPVAFDLGIIAGTESFNPLLSQMLPAADDGKVSVENTKVQGMCGFLTVPSTHTFIMRSDLVIEQVIAYLLDGRFSHPDAQQFNCTVNAD